MSDVIYHIVVLAVAVLAVVRGWSLGFARQTPSVIGIAFGIVSARILAPPFADALWGAFPSIHGQVHESFAYGIASTGMIFCGIYFLFVTVTGFLGKVLKGDDRTILDNIGGSAFTLLKYMLFLSLAYNFLVAVNPTSPLMRAGKSDDGNVVEEVMLLAPALLGGEDVADLAHRLQLHEAKKIS